MAASASAAGAGATAPHQVSTSQLLTSLLESGIDVSRPDVKAEVEALTGGAERIDLSTVLEHPDSITFKTLTGHLAMPDWKAFTTDVRSIFEEIKREVHGGHPATYIPILAEANPETFAVAITTVDGQQFSYGDIDAAYSIQSCTKPLMYAVAVEDRGLSYVHRHVGYEPSGLRFNEVSLNAKQKPHNPYINSGAIATGSLIGPGLDSAAKFRHYMDRLGQIAGEKKIGFSHATYLCEHETAWRNNALVAYMTDAGVFPKSCKPSEALDFYLQCCSIEVTTSQSANIAATLANGGVCPLTGVKALNPVTTKSTLSLMFSCGMYDYSGTWMSTVGLPAKSGVAGLIYVVVPHVMGIAVFAPPLDGHGNSVRGVEFCKRLLRRYPFGIFDQIVSGRRLTSLGGAGGGAATSGGAGAGAGVGSATKDLRRKASVPTITSGASTASGSTKTLAGGKGSSSNVMTALDEEEEDDGRSKVSGTASGSVYASGGTRTGSAAAAAAAASFLLGPAASPAGPASAPAGLGAAGASASRIDAWRRIGRHFRRIYTAFKRIRYWCGLPVTKVDLVTLLNGAAADSDAPLELLMLRSRVNGGASGKASRSGSEDLTIDAETTASVEAGGDLVHGIGPSGLPLLYEAYKEYRSAVGASGGSSEAWSLDDAASAAVAAARATMGDAGAGRRGSASGASSADTADEAPAVVTARGRMGEVRPSVCYVPLDALKLFVEYNGVSVGPDNPFVHSLWQRLIKAAGPSRLIHLADLFLPGVRNNIIVRALLGGLAMPHFPTFISDILSIYDNVKRKEKSGTVFKSLPIEELNNADPEAFGVSIVTVDGQMVNIGETEIDFPLMGAVRPLLYALACKDVGVSEVERWVAVEPTAADPQTFNLMAAGDGEGHGGPPPKAKEAKEDEGAAKAGASRSVVATPAPVAAAGAGKASLPSSPALAPRPTASGPGPVFVPPPPFTPEPDRAPHPRPFNAFLDSGALAICSLIGRAHYPPEKRLFHDNGSRFSHMINELTRWCGNRKIGFNNSVFLAQKEKRLKTLAISYFAKGMEVFPAVTEPNDTANYLFQAEAIEMNCQRLAVIAATLANIGVCPLTQEKCIEPGVMRSVLSLMYNSGLGPYTGAWMFTVGIPASAGVSGAHMIVVPGLFGIAIYAPRLNEMSVPARAVQFCEMLTSRYRVNTFDQLVYADMDVAIATEQRASAPVTMAQSLMQYELCTAASVGDAGKVTELLSDGADPNTADYDLRTALHIACSDGQEAVVRLLVEAGAHILVKDRWGSSPLDDAVRRGHHRIVQLLEEALVAQGMRVPTNLLSPAAHPTTAAVTTAGGLPRMTSSSAYHVSTATAAGSASDSASVPEPTAATPPLTALSFAATPARQTSFGGASTGAGAVPTVATSTTVTPAATLARMAAAGATSAVFTTPHAAATATTTSATTAGVASKYLTAVGGRTNGSASTAVSPANGGSRHAGYSGGGAGGAV